jgi:hypothetical protein
MDCSALSLCSLQQICRCECQQGRRRSSKPVFCWLAHNDLLLYVIDTYVGETYTVNNDDKIADSG